MRYTNPSGYVRYDSEEELKIQLEQRFFPVFFDKGWKPQIMLTKEVSPSENSLKRIDYYGTIKNKSTWIEVKNWWVTKSDLRQIYKYIQILKQPYNFYVICGGIEKLRKIFLEEFKIKIILTRNIQEINPEEVSFWM